MATHAPTTGAPTRASFISAPPPAITRVLAAFDRDQLAGFVAVAIDLLDLADGDPDREEDDPPESAGDDLGDQSYPEWHTRGRHKLTARGAEAATGFAMLEDVEEDDADMGIEDDPLGFDPEEDVEHDGREPDHDDEAEDREARLIRQPHRDRIRRTRCDRIVYHNGFNHRDHVEYRLRESRTADV
ncbi:hypothetical protein ACMT1E_15050 [Sphingomonas flavalba]|uniref:hypothetical protein n=1 Tax=Sphingomonas flavalba TaxID=2559804 RepID=UPI0039E104A4